MMKAVALLVLAMIATIVAIDFVFLRRNFTGRLTANVVTVVIFAVAYLLFFRRS